MYGTILVPTDGSDASMRALDEAVEIAKDQDATVHVLSVTEPPEMASMGSGGAEVVESIHEGARRAVDDAVERAESAGLENITESIASGAVHEVIVSYVEDNDVDLVVMGTHGRTGLDRVLLGSITQKVARLSPVPVLTVGPRKDTNDGE